MTGKERRHFKTVPASIELQVNQFSHLSRSLACGRRLLGVDGYLMMLALRRIAVASRASRAHTVRCMVCAGAHVHAGRTHSQADQWLHCGLWLRCPVLLSTSAALTHRKCSHLCTGGLRAPSPQVPPAGVQVCARHPGEAWAIPRRPHCRRQGQGKGVLLEGWQGVGWQQMVAATRHLVR